MTNGASLLGEEVGRLAADDPAFAGFVRPGTGVLVWDEAAERILWASSSALDLAHALGDPSGAADLPSSVRDRLRVLATGLAPDRGIRLEKLRLDPTRLAPFLTCACRRAVLGGQAVLITAIVGAVPKVAPRRPASPSPEPAALGKAPRAFEPQGTVRFVWQADAETRFVHVSPALADTVGPMAADVVGQTWAEICLSVAEDPAGTVADLLARRETFSGQVVHWSIDNSTLKLPVDWAGMPVYGPGRALIGFRGFGLLRTDAAVPPAAAFVEPGPDAADHMESPEEPGLDPAVDGSEWITLFEDEPAGSVPGVPNERSPAPAEAPDSAGGREEGWFAGLRGRVAATLAGAKAKAKPEEVDPGAGPPARAKPVESGGLTNVERSAFREIARALGARFEDEAASPEAAASLPAQMADLHEDLVAPEPTPVEAAAAATVLPADIPTPAAVAGAEADLLERIPAAVLVRRGESILFANRALLDWVGYETAGQLAAEGGMARLFRDGPTLEEGNPPVVTFPRRDGVPVEVQSATVAWEGAPADLLLIRRIHEPEAPQRLRAVERDLRQREARLSELEAILDTATDGVIVLDETGRILTLNRSAEALFGYDESEVVGDAITVLLAPESHIVALDYLEGLRSPGVASLLNDGRDVMGLVRQGGAIPLFMTMGRVNEGQDRKFCAVLRDITAFKKAEGELIAAKRAAEEASAQKSDLLAKISHEIRTPLNAIIGFAEVMLEERFGPVGNDRYKDYLKDVHASGTHVMSLVNDLLDLAKIEAGRMELSFTSVSLNDLVSTCVTLLQPQASRDRIVMRTSFASKLPPVVADERSVRQIVLNLVSNAIKFTDAGGQVIVSTAMTDRGELAFRVRDTGIGMTPEEVEAALEPFRQLATARKRGGTGLGLPLTKALVEANRGALQITSSRNEGTLVEVLFPPTRVLAE